MKMHQGLRPRSVQLPGQGLGGNAGRAGRRADYGLRARDSLWPPLRPTRLCCEHASVGVVRRLHSLTFPKPCASSVGTSTATSARSRSWRRGGCVPPRESPRAPRRSRAPATPVRSPRSSRPTSPGSPSRTPSRSGRSLTRRSRPTGSTPPPSPSSWQRGFFRTAMQSPGPLRAFAQRIAARRGGQRRRRRGRTQDRRALLASAHARDRLRIRSPHPRSPEDPPTRAHHRCPFQAGPARRDQDLGPAGGARGRARDRHPSGGVLPTSGGRLVSPKAGDVHSHLTFIRSPPAPVCFASGPSAR